MQIAVSTTKSKCITDSTTEATCVSESTAEVDLFFGWYSLLRSSVGLGCYLLGWNTWAYCY